MKKILFISHDASRTGAPILLLNLFSAVKDDYEIHFLIKNGGGVLTDKFTSLTKTFVAKKPTASIWKRVAKKIFFNQIKFDLTKIKKENYDYIISNTITNGDILIEIREFYRGPILSYIHELEMASTFFTSEERLKQLIKCSDGYLVPSLAVKNHLINNLKLNQQSINLLPYYIPNTNLDTKKENHTQFIIGGSGTIDWRKGSDLFLLVASLIFKKHPRLNLKFKWKGTVQGINLDRLLYESKKLRLHDKIEFIEASDEVETFYKNIDVFLLTSREDPYPLVVLEAASYGVPTIAFEDAGGAPEFIHESGGGKTTPFMDIDAIANEIMNYFMDRESCVQDGIKALRLLAHTHQNDNFIKNKFKQIIDDNG